MGGLPPDTDSNMWPSPPPVAHPPLHAGASRTFLLYKYNVSPSNPWLSLDSKSPGAFSQHEFTQRKFILERVDLNMILKIIRDG